MRIFLQRFAKYNIVFLSLFSTIIYPSNIHWNVLHLTSILFNFNWFYWIYIRIAFLFTPVPALSFTLSLFLRSWIVRIKYAHHYQANYRWNIRKLCRVVYGTHGNLMCKILYKEEAKLQPDQQHAAAAANALEVFIYTCLQTIPLTNWTTKL